jgi:hypothetical protein
MQMCVHLAPARPFSEAPAVQMDRVYDFGSKGRGFELGRVQINNQKPICGRFGSQKNRPKKSCSAIYPPLWTLCDGLGKHR